MKSLIAFSFFIIFTLQSALVFAIETRSSVEFQWEMDPKAAEYEIQISNQQGELIKELKSKDNNFKVKMPVNKYKVRGRIKTKLGNYSPWSKDTELLIPPKKVNITNDKVQTRVLNADSKTLTSKTTINWTPSPQAKNYIIKLKDASGKIFTEQEINHPHSTLEIPPGIYKYSITAVAPNGIPSDEVESKEVLQVKAATLAKPKFAKETDINGKPHFVFEKIPGVLIRGELHYTNFLSENWMALEKYEELKESKWEAVSVTKPGRYKIYFWASANGASDSEKINEEFVVKPKEVDLL